MFGTKLINYFKKAQIWFWLQKYLNTFTNENNPVLFGKWTNCNKNTVSKSVAILYFYLQSIRILPKVKETSSSCEKCGQWIGCMSVFVIYMWCLIMDLSWLLLYLMHKQQLHTGFTGTMCTVKCINNFLRGMWAIS